MPPHATSSVQVPAQWRACLAALLENARPTLDVLSVFDGQGSLSRACSDAGLVTGSFEILSGTKHEDCLQEEGVQHFLTQLASVAANGLVWFSPPGCSWICFTRSKSKRSKTNPAGSSTDAWTLHHNQIADFVALALEACTARGLYFVLEQPAGSLLFDYEPISRALRMCQAGQVSVSLWDFGAESTKPLALWGTAPWLGRLRDRRPTLCGRRKRKRLVTYSCASVTGIGCELQASAAYPGPFSAAIAALHVELLGRMMGRLWRKVCNSKCVYSRVHAVLFLFLSTASFENQSQSAKWLRSHVWNRASGLC